MGHLQPLKAVRKCCLWCCTGQVEEVRLCPAETCPIWPYRFGRNPEKGEKLKLKTIRARCLDCSGFILSEVKNCDRTNCELYDYRMGHNPKLAGKSKKPPSTSRFEEAEGEEV